MALLLAATLPGCGDEPTMPAWPDGGTGGTGGTDGNGECEPYVASDWGQTCTPLSSDCPPGTECRTVQGMGSNYGICSTECCGQDDLDHCPDVAPGLETCIVLHVDDTWWCAVVCTTSDHCPDGENQTCQPTPEASQSICYPEQG
jgi:hypothetical protein